MVNTRGGGDSPFLLQRTLDMAENLRHGIFPPRWMAHAAYDLGYPFFNHYAALPFYLSGGLTALSLSPILAIQATQTLGFLLAALTMALWARRVYANRWAVLLAAAAYTFAPFHLVNVYVRGDSLSEFWAFVWYPLILWTLARAAEQPTLRRGVFAALSYAALILTHNVSALIFAPLALLYAVSQQISNRQISKSRFTHHVSRFTQYAVRSTFPFLLAFLLTAWFWIPAIGETGYGQMGPEFTAGYFHYSNHFRGLDLVQPTFFFNYAVAGSAADAGPFTMGLVQAALALLGAGVLIWQIGGQAKRQESESANHVLRFTQYAVRSTQYEYILFSLTLSTLMITPLSALLWEHLPLLETTQFPWRFLSVQALFTAIATGAVVNRQIGKLQIANSKIQNGAAGLLCLLLAIAALGALRPERLLITAEDVTWDNLLLYEAFTGNIGTTIRYEYLPRDVRPRLYISDAVVDGVDAAQLIADGDVTLAATLLARAPQRQVWRVALDGAAPVVFPLHWWPGWQAEVDGVLADAYPVTGSGRLAVDLAAGEHEVALRLRNTPLRAAAAWISALTALALGVVVFQRKGAKAQRCREDWKWGLLIKVVLVTGLMLGIAVLLPVVASWQQLLTSPRSFDFIHIPFAMRGLVYFGTTWHAELATGDATLTHTAPLPEIITPGQTLTVPMSWDLPTPKPITATLRLISPAEPRHGVPYGLAETTFTLTRQITPTMQLPTDLSRGLYLLELRVFGVDGELPARTITGAERGALYIGAVRLRSTLARRADAPVAAQLGELTLHSATSLRSASDTLRLQLTWSLARRTPRNWSLSLRLLDADGRQLSQADMQPGYGYLPTTLWRAGDLVTDYPTLALPAGLAPGDYTLRVIAYLEATMGTGGEVDMPITLTQVTLRDPRESCCEQERKGATVLCAADGMALYGLDLPAAIVEGGSFDFTAEWNALTQPSAEFAARWELLTPAGDSIGATEGPLAPGSRAAGWPRFAWVRAPVHIALPPTLSAGPYRLRLTLANDRSVESCDLLPEIPVTLRARAFTAPALPFTQTAAFGAALLGDPPLGDPPLGDPPLGDVLHLLGYDFTQSHDALTLTLWWQAQIAPAQDYKRFVHLYDAVSGAVPAQDDAMPRAWTYPTSLWAAGEVVSETITLPLAGIPAGSYQIGVGWYDPASGARLSASDAAGQAIPDARVTLAAIQLHK